MSAHDASDPLLVDTSRSGRGEVHADGSARRVPPLRQKLGVDQHVDLTALVSRQRLGQFHRGSATADRLGLEPGGAEFLGEVVGVIDARRVDDPGRVVEAIAVEAGGRLVESRVVEHLSQCPLVEVAADDGDGVDRRDRWYAQAAKRRDQPAPGGILQR